MELHPRQPDVAAARRILSGAVAALIDAHELTAVETIGILLVLAAEQQVFALRAERHQDSDKKADEA